MERVKRPLSDLGDRQKRRRAIDIVQSKLGEMWEESAGSSSDENASISSVASELEPAEIESPQVSEASVDYPALGAPLTDTECGDVSDVDEGKQPEEYTGQPPTEGQVPSTLSSKLADWALRTSIPSSHLTGLLKLLQPYHHELPADARTLLKTLRTSDVAQMGSGSYHYFGLASGLAAEVASACLPGECCTLSLSVNVDGLPISRSSRKQFWPILVSVKESGGQTPFLVALYEGNAKPEDVSIFMKDFVEEMTMLLANGICLRGKIYDVRLRAFICDAPARAYLKGIKGHTAYFGCEKCTVKGKHDGKKVIFADVSAPLRTDNDFRDQVNASHHHDVSPLLALGAGLVSIFPLDYMHLVCLGVMKKLLLQYWTSSTPSLSKLPVRARLEISEKLTAFRAQTPSEFSRKPRSLNEREHWKAVELRNFLLYFGPPLLGKYLEKRFYAHFIKLSCAITILASPKFALTHCDLAESLLREFVSEAGTLYGNGIYVYNVHSLIHLAQDVRQFGPLDTFSAFPFENYLGKLKKLVRGPALALQQVIKRHSELASTSLPSSKGQQSPLLNEHHDGPEPPNFQGSQYCEFILHGTHLSVKLADNCVQVKDGNVVIIRNFLKEKEKISICGQFFKVLDNLYVSGVPSSQLGIFKASQLSSEYSLWSVKDVKCKCVCLAYEQGSYAIFALAHLHA